MSLARRTFQVAVLLLTLVVGAASLAAIVTQTPWFKEWLRGFIVRQADDYVNGRLSIGRLEGNLLFGVELDDVEVAMSGKTVVDIEEVAIDYNAFTLLGGGVALDDIRLTRPVFRLERTAEGWNLGRLVKARTPDPDEPKSRPTIAVDRIAIEDGTLYIDDGAVGTAGVEVPARIDHLDAAVGVTSDEDVLAVTIEHVSLRAVDPALSVETLSGVIRRTPNEVTFEDVELRTERSALSVSGAVSNVEGSRKVVDLRASSPRFDLSEIGRLVPALRGYALDPSFDVTVAGPLDRMAVDLTARSDRLGAVDADVTVDAAAEDRRIAGTVRVQSFNVAAVTRGEADRPTRLRSDITGRAEVDLVILPGGEGVRGSYQVTADRVAIAGYEARNLTGRGRIDGRTIQVDAAADAYGGHATAAGTVQAREPLALDLSGRAAGVDLRDLPRDLNLPAVESDLQFRYDLSMRGSTVRADATLDGSTLAGAAIAPGTTGRVSVGGGAPQYAATGSVTDLDVQHVGQAFNIQAIAGERYRSRISGDFDVSGSGGGRYPLALDATGTLVDSELFGASIPQMRVAARIDEETIAVDADGRFAKLDPSAVTGREQLAGTVTGTVDATVTIRAYDDGVAPGDVDASGQLLLEDSTVRGLEIRRAVLEGQFADRRGEIARLEVAGPTLDVTAQGPIALDESGASNLTVHAETSSLERLGALLGRPLKGSAIVDATVTGNARDLQAQGTLTGSNIGYGDNEALTLDSTFSLAVPNLEVAGATIQATSMATLAEIGGQQINELTAETTYDGSTLGFTATAQQGTRQLTAAGDMVLRDGYQEIHVDDLTVRAGDVVWQTVPASTSTIQYADGRVEVQDLQLVSGDQRLRADGTFGVPGRSLRVRVENVDVAQLDAALFGGNRQLAGRLEADAEITGTTERPNVDAQFTLANGAFRQFTFESLTGTVDYAGDDLALDVRLQQTPTAWITASGTAPVSLFRPNPPGMEDAEGVGDPVDLRVESSEIDLGLVQGFTTYLTEVTGTLKADVRVIGTGYDPHLEGMVDIRGGAFAIPDLGTSYTGLDTRLDLTPDQVAIEEFKILDNRGFPMTVGGTLAVHERAVGAVNVQVQSENFEVIDNQFADLKLDTDLRITGDLRRPRVIGFVEVENGTIHVGEVLARTTADPYATEATALQPAAPAQQVTADQSLLDAIELDLAVAMPSNLVLRGTDIRPANAPIEIGDITVTVGGAVQVQKAAGGDPRLTGEVNTIRGTYNFQGRRFDILREGRIRFSGLEEINPSIDIRTRRLIQGVEAFVRVHGTMRQPELSFSSSPPMEEAEVLSLIVFNQQLNQLGEGQQLSLAERAGALAGGYLASGLSRSIANALELDEFEIQAAGENGLGPSLTVGEQVGEKFFFRVRQGFGEAEATELILEYQIADFLRVQGTAAETSGGTQRVTFRRVERAGIDLIFFFSY